MNTFRSSLLTILRALGGFFLLAWGFHAVGAWRTTWTGFSWQGFLEEGMVAAIFVLPLAAILFLGLSKWRYAGALLLSIITPIFLAETWAAVEEFRFKTDHRAANGRVLESRSIFDKNWMAYDPATGKLSGGD